MERNDSAIAVFDTHNAAEDAIKRLATAGFDMKNLSIVGRGYHTEEKAVGFYNVGSRIKFWGKQGAYWGGLWGLFFGGVFVTLPAVGSIVVLGYLAAALISTLEGAAVIGGLSALGAALYSLGIPKDSIVAYETAVKADRFLVMAHGHPEDVARAKAVLALAKPSRLDTHEGAASGTPAALPVPATA